MSIIKYFIPFLILSFPSCVYLSKKTQPPEISIIEKVVDSLIYDLIENQQVPGCIISITSKDSLIFSKSYGYSDIKLKKKVHEKTLFQIGSITKSFTAIALMQLYDQGKFDPFKPLSEYVDWFNINGNNPPVTGHHLLTHTAGIPNVNDEIYPSPAIGIMAAQLNSSWKPGEKFHYSNSAYIILHLLIEHLSGIPYREYIEKNILQPIGMLNTNVGITLDSRKEQAIGYGYPYDDRPHHPSRDLVEMEFFEYGMGDGCIQSTATDMAKYMQMLMNRGQILNKRILSNEAFELFTGINSKHSSNHWYQYGINITQEDSAIQLAHSGGMVGFSSNLRVDLINEIGIFISTNIHQCPYLMTVSDFNILVNFRNLQSGQRIEFPDFPRKSNNDKTDLNRYIGKYKSAHGQQIEVENQADTLFLINEETRLKLEQVDTTKFYSPQPGFDKYYWTFTMDSVSHSFQLIYGDKVLFTPEYDPIIDSNIPEDWSHYIGKYRSYSPWFPYIEIIYRNGKLILIKDYGREEELIEIKKGEFKTGSIDSPEYIKFEGSYIGHALIAKVTGHTFYWID